VSYSGVSAEHKALEVDHISRATEVGTVFVIDDLVKNFFSSSFSKSVAIDGSAVQ
jgi:hypothetical protein